MKPKGSRVYNWTGCGELTGDKWNQIVRSANGKKGRTPITLIITIQEAWELFEKQGRKCALTGLDINLNGREGTASLDRIDSNQGYIHGNIQWVHKDINRMKNVYSQERFIQCCNLVAKIHPYGASCEWKPPEEKK
jgi:hypothetical protein